MEATVEATPAVVDVAPSLVDAQAPEVEEVAAPRQRRLNFRFRPQEDIVVLREVINRFPWGAGHGNKRTAWVEAATAVQEQLVVAGDKHVRDLPVDYMFTIIKRRVDVMLAAVRRGEMDTLRGGAATKAVTARNRLLVILSNVMDEHYKLKGRTFRLGVSPTREEIMNETLRVAWERAAAVDLTDLEALDPDAVAAAAANPLAVNQPKPPTPRRGTKREIGPSESPHETEEIVAPPRRGRGRPPKNPKTVKTESSASASFKPTPITPSPTSSFDADKREISFRERELRLKTRRLELEERRFEWELKQAELQTKERLALLDLLRAQSALNDELLRHLKSASPSSA